jgi:hypothetical protein
MNYNQLADKMRTFFRTHEQRLGTISLIMVVLVVAIGIVGLSLNWYEPRIAGYLLDKGGLESLFATVLVAVVWMYVGQKKLRSILVRARKNATSFPWILVLVVTGFVGIWLSVRKLGLLVSQYLFVSGYGYTQYEIIDTIAFVLAARLCFSLAKTLGDVEQGKGKAIKQIIDATMQAVLIGLITILPRYGDSNLITQITINGYVLLLIGITITLAILSFLRQYVQEE